MRRVRLLEEAVNEALEAAAYYEQECPGLGVAFFAELDAALDLLEGELVPLVSMPVQFGATDLKRLILARFPYDVVVTDHGDEFLVLADFSASKCVKCAYPEDTLIIRDFAFSLN